MGVYVDIQGAQSRDSGLRGIGRYVAELVRALEARDGGALIAGYALNPELPVSDVMAAAIPASRMLSSDAIELRPGDVYHVTSPFEATALARVWPRAARERGVRLAVTLYDLIPLVYPEHYLAHDVYRARYENRLGLVRLGDRVLAISAATARDAVERLGVSAGVITVAGAGVSPVFSPAADPDAAFIAAARRIPGLRPGYVLYTGALDFRKNVDALLIAYAQLPAETRREHQLVIVSRLSRGDVEGLGRRLRELAVADTVLLASSVSDTDLVQVYQSAGLFVFPSLYEGFGLPAAEAIACGTPTLVARTSSLVEIVRDESAFFDPRDPDELATAMQRALTDPEVRDRLAGAQLDDRHRWPAVADTVLEAYAELAGTPGQRDRAARRSVAALAAAEESPWSASAAGVRPSVAVRVARAVLWPLRRFFDPRFGGVDEHVISLHGDLAHRMEAAFGPASEAAARGERLEHQLEDLHAAVDELRAAQGGGPELARLPFVVAAAAGLPAGARVLDCGPAGSAAAALAGLGLDVVVLAPGGYPLQHPNIRIATATLETYAGEGRFDAAVLHAGSVIDVAAAVERLRGLVRPGGLLVLSAGDDAGLGEIAGSLEDAELGYAAPLVTLRARISSGRAAAPGSTAGTT